MMPAMTGPAMQARSLLALDPVAETPADPHSYGFRSQRCGADAIARGVRLFSHKTSPQWVLQGDSKGCVDAAEQTVLTPWEDGFDLLGQTVGASQAKLLSKPSKQSVHRRAGNRRRPLKENQHAPAAGLMVPLHPRIRGWAC